MDNNRIREFFNSYAISWDDDMEGAADRIEMILDAIAPMEGMDILDVGAGTGVLVPFLLERNVGHITECDISEGMMEVNREKYRDRTDISHILGDASNLDFPQQYDRIIIYNAFPHFSDRQQLIQNLAASLKMDSYLVIAHSRTSAELEEHHKNISSELYSHLGKAEGIAALLEKEFTDIFFQDEPFFMVRGRKA